MAISSKGKVAEMWANDYKSAFLNAVDLTGGDFMAGSLLSRIIIFSIDGGVPRVRRDGYVWLRVRRTDWWQKARMTPREYDRAIKVLVRRGLVETRILKTNPTPTTHIRPLWDRIADGMSELIEEKEEAKR